MVIDDIAWQRVVEQILLRRAFVTDYFWPVVLFHLMSTPLVLAIPAEYSRVLISWVPQRRSGGKKVDEGYLVVYTTA